MTCVHLRRASRPYKGRRRRDAVGASSARHQRERRERRTKIIYPTHRPKRWVETAGYGAACWCGWRTLRRTRARRDQDLDAHVTESAADRVMGAPADADQPDPAA
jgi:hypothetical protein